MKLNVILALLAVLCFSPPVVAQTGSQEVTSAWHGDADRPAEAIGWVKSELYFGLGDESGESSRQQTDYISETQWRAFLDKEVTSRFPNGLTVLDAYGQWLFQDTQQLHRLRTKVLIVHHEDSPERRNDIEAIRLAWKRDTGHQSVLWSKSPASVSF